ncbi:MAG: prepilin-type N-terminal cleavage/methylation domain-containing protein [Candidatus Komeilibacteria bacterium]
MFKEIINKRGYSLAEVIIAIGIFSIVSVIVSSVYLSANSLQQHTASLQRLQNEGRYIAEKITREIRGREIDYSEVLKDDQPQEYINFLKDEIGEEVKISLIDSNLEYDIGGGTSANLNADDVDVVNAKFYIIPDEQGTWGLDPATNYQPRVTVLLELRSDPPNPKFQQSVILQTTISSKVYKR